MNEYEIPDDAYEALYGEDFEASKERYPLPAVVRDWVKEGSKYSKNNEFALTMLYFVALGQILKDFVRIPVDANVLDSRIHFTWFQTQRTGKTAAWKFIKKATDNAFHLINATEYLTEMNGPYNIETRHNGYFDTFSVHEYTDAALIGTIRQNKKYNPPEDEDELENYTEEPYIKSIGGLEGSGLAHFDEFESSGLFKPTSHKENILMYFQTFMNGLDSEAYVIRKKLAEFEYVLECDCQRSMYATTYVPQNFIDVIANSGVLQRSFTFVREVPDEIRRKNSIELISKIGIKTEDTMQVQKFAIHLAKTFDMAQTRWNACGQNAEQVIEIPSAVRDVITQYYIWMQNDVEMLRPKVKRIAESFIQNLINYQTMLSALIAIANGRFRMTHNDAHCAGRLVRHSYSALTEWLNQAIRRERESVVQSAQPDVFIKAYEDSQKDKEGWVHKTRLLQKVMEVGKIARAQAYNRFNKVESMFEMDKIGNATYLKLKEEAS